MAMIKGSRSGSAQGRWSHVLCQSASGAHTMAYQEWGDPENPDLVVCVHGLTRTSDDFQVIANALSGQYRVVAPDVVGRGRSSWLCDPMAYGVPQYASDMLVLLDSLAASKVKWIGTSMGGLIGMSLAALPDSVIDRLVLNDVGAVLSGQALQRIAQYVGQHIEFDSHEQGTAVLRKLYAGFGPHTQAQWAQILSASLVPIKGSAKYRVHYDPAIAAPFRAAYAPSEPNEQSSAQDLELWTLYDAITCPTLLIRGQQSDLVSFEVFREMQQRGPRAQGVEIAGVGHAPTLMHDDQIAVIEKFFSL